MLYGDAIQSFSTMKQFYMLIWKAVLDILLIEKGGENSRTIFIIWLYVKHRHVDRCICTQMCTHITNAKKNMWKMYTIQMIGVLSGKRDRSGKRWIRGKLITFTLYLLMILNNVKLFKIFIKHTLLLWLKAFWIITNRFDIYLSNLVQLQTKKLDLIIKTSYQYKLVG